MLWIVGSLAACSVDSSPTSVTQDGLDFGPDPNVTQNTSTQYFSPSGGQLQGTTGSFEVTPGALLGGTRLTMKTSFIDGSYQCEMSPHGQQFEVGCTLSIKKPPRHLAGEVYTVFWWDEDAREWVDLGGTSDGDWVSTTIHHFSTYKISIAVDRAR